MRKRTSDNPTSCSRSVLAYLGLGLWVTRAAGFPSHTLNTVGLRGDEVLTCSTLQIPLHIILLALNTPVLRLALGKEQKHQPAHHEDSRGEVEEDPPLVNVRLLLLGF